MLVEMTEEKKQREFAYFESERKADREMHELSCWTLEFGVFGLWDFTNLALSVFAKSMTARVDLSPLPHSRSTIPPLFLLPLCYSLPLHHTPFQQR